MDTFLTLHIDEKRCCYRARMLDNFLPRGPSPPPSLSTNILCTHTHTQPQDFKDYADLWLKCFSLGTTGQYDT